MTTFSTLIPRSQQLIKLGIGANLSELWNPAYETPLFTPYQGESTADGTAGGMTIEDSGLATDYNGYRAYILDKASARCNEERAIDQDTSGGTIHVSEAFGGQIVLGVGYWINGIAIRDVAAHESDKGLDSRLFNFVEIHAENTLDKAVSIQLMGGRRGTTTGARNIGPSFNVATNDEETRAQKAEDGWAEWLYITATCSVAPASGLLFAYGILRNI